MKGLFEKICSLGEKYNLNTVFFAQNTSRGYLTRTKSKTQYSNKNCICEVQRECGLKYISETGRPLKVRLKEHQSNIKRAEMIKSIRMETPPQHPLEIGSQNIIQKRIFEKIENKENGIRNTVC